MILRNSVLQNSLAIAEMVSAFCYSQEVSLECKRVA